MRYPHDVPVLTAGDVRLRAVGPEDVDQLVDTYTDADVVRWTSVRAGFDAATARDWVTKTLRDGWESGRAFVFAVEAMHPDGRRLCSGTVALEARESRRFELGFACHPAVRRRGILGTAVRVLLDWAFVERDVEVVLWQAQRGNLASRRIAWREGFTIQAGHLSRWQPNGGGLRDCWVGTLHRGDPRTPRNRWLDVPVVEGDRVRLRPHRVDDVPRIAEAAADPVSQHWLTALPRRYEESHAHDYLLHVAEEAATGESVSWAIADSGTDRLLGSLSLHRVQRGQAEVGYLAHPDARGQGTTTAAVRLALRHAFVPEEEGGLGLRRVSLRAAAGNLASQRVARRVGLVETGRERASELLSDGSYDDVVLFDLLAAEALHRRDDARPGAPPPP